MIGLDRSMFGRDRRSLDQRQQVTLHTLARHVGAYPSFACGDLVDLVEEYDAVLLDGLDGLEYQLVVVEELIRFLVDQDVIGFRDRDAASLGAAACELAEDIANRDRTHLCAGHPGNFEQGHTTTARLYLDLNLLVVELAGAQPFSKRVLGRGVGMLTD